MELQQRTYNFFLLFFLVSQQVIAIACAVYYFHNGKPFLVIFFIAICSSILLALVCYCIFSLFTTSKWVLLFTIIIGCIFLIVNSSDQISAIWCLTAVCVISLLLGHNRGIIVITFIYTVAIIYLLAGLSPYVSIKYDGTLKLRFLFSYGVVILLSMVMEQYRLNVLRHSNSASPIKHNIELLDILTQLPHRQCVEENLKLSYRKFEAEDCDFCIILVDLDNCREINDRYGREAGDLALTKLGQMLRNELRENDIAGRWSGNQFILILPEISQNIAAAIAERIRQKACLIDLFFHTDTLEITLSIGVCSTENSSGLDDLLTTAENCVYQAKQMGRNMVIGS